jgi:ribosomal protein S2
MKSYVYKRNKDGIHYLDLAKTWEKLMVAARIIAAAQAKNPKDVLVSKFDLISRLPNERFSRLIDYN